MGSSNPLSPLHLLASGFSFPELVNFQSDIYCLIVDMLFSRTIQVDSRQVIVKQVIPESPVHVPMRHVHPSPQIHIQPSAPGEISQY